MRKIRKGIRKERKTGKEKILLQIYRFHKIGKFLLRAAKTTADKFDFRPEAKIIQTMDNQ